MDNIRYQVFISSTYADLKEERQAVIHTIIEANGIPAGMELFPAVDEEQLAFIKRVIDDCDYYLLIIGGRYGSVSEAGISYTEQEYDYAVNRGLKVIALLHENPGEIAFDKSEQNPEFREKLKQFRTKVSKGRLVRTWKTAQDLPGLVALSLLSTIREFPAVGWTRANKPANEQILAEINELRKRNIRLEKALADAQAVPAVEGLAGLDESVAISGYYYSRNGRKEWDAKTTWRKLFGYIAPYLIECPTDSKVHDILQAALFAELRDRDASNESLDGQFFKTVGLQLKALGLVKVQYLKSTTGYMGLFWSLTPAGERLMMQIRTVRAKAPGHPIPQG